MTRGWRPELYDPAPDGAPSLPGQTLIAAKLELPCSHPEPTMLYWVLATAYR